MCDSERGEFLDDGGKKPGVGFFGMKNCCCIEGESGVSPVNGIALEMLGLGRLGS